MLQGNTPPSSYIRDLSRRIWNLRARLERGETDAADDLKAALAERAQYRCRDI